MYGVICRIGSQLSHYCFWQTLIQTDRALRKKVPRIKSKRILSGHCTLCADHLTDLNICYSFFSIRDTERPFHQNRGIKNYHLKVLLYCLLLNYINLNKDHLHHEIPSFFPHWCILDIVTSRYYQEHIGFIGGGPTNSSWLQVISLQRIITQICSFHLLNKASLWISADCLAATITVHIKKQAAVVGSRAAAISWLIDLLEDNYCKLF